MLSKLLKYEFRDVGRILCPVWLGTLALCLLAKLAWLLNWSVPAIVMTVISVLALLAALCSAGLVMLYRFYQMMGQQGYFQFSLPASPAQQLAAKLISGIGGLVVSTAVFLLGALMLASSGSEGTFLPAAELTELVRDFLSPEGLLVLLMLLVCLVASVLFLYWCICLGGHWPQHRLIASVAVGYGLSFVLQISLLVVILVVALIPGLVQALQNFVVAAPIMVPVICTLIFAAADIILWTIVHHHLKNRLNLP